MFVPLLLSGKDLVPSIMAEMVARNSVCCQMLTFFQSLG